MGLGGRSHRFKGSGGTTLQARFGWEAWLCNLATEGNVSANPNATSRGAANFRAVAAPKLTLSLTYTLS